MMIIHGLLITISLRSVDLENPVGIESRKFDETNECLKDKQRGFYGLLPENDAFQSESRQQTQERRISSKIENELKKLKTLIENEPSDNACLQWQDKEARIEQQIAILFTEAQNNPDYLSSIKSAALESLEFIIKSKGEEDDCDVKYVEVLNKFVTKLLQHFFNIVDEGSNEWTNEIGSLFFLSGQLLMESNRFISALKQLEQSLAWQTQIHGKENREDISQVLKTIGDCHYKSKNISEAIVYLKRSLDMQMALVDSESVTSDLDISTLLQSLGAFHKEAGEFETALSYFLQSHERKKKTHGTEAHPEVVDSLFAIGFCLENLKRHSEAVHFYENSKDLRRKILGEKANSAELATDFTHLGNCYQSLGENSKALGYYKLSLATHHALYGRHTRHPGIAASLNNLGFYYENVDETAKAISYYEQSLEMKKEIYGEENHLDVAFTFSNLGLCHFDLDQLELAEKNLNKAVNMMEAILGKKSKNQNLLDARANLKDCKTELEKK